MTCPVIDDGSESEIHYAFCETCSVSFHDGHRHLAQLISPCEVPQYAPFGNGEPYVAYGGHLCTSVFESVITGLYGNKGIQFWVTAARDEGKLDEDLSDLTLSAATHFGEFRKILYSLSEHMVFVLQHFFGIVKRTGANGNIHAKSV